MPVQKSKKSAKPSAKPKAKPAAKSPVKKANVKVAAKPVKRASPAGKLEKSKKVVISVKASGRLRRKHVRIGGSCGGADKTVHLASASSGHGQQNVPG